MKIGDLVKEKYTTGRVGIVVDVQHQINGERLKVVYTTGETDECWAYHFWPMEVINENR